MGWILESPFGFRSLGLSGACALAGVGGLFLNVACMGLLIQLRETAVDIIGRMSGGSGMIISRFLGLVLIAAAFMAPVVFFGSDEPAVASADTHVPHFDRKHKAPGTPSRTVVRDGSFWRGVWDDFLNIFEIDHQDTVGRFDPDAAVYIDHFGTKQKPRHPQFNRAFRFDGFDGVSDALASFKDDYFVAILDDVSDYFELGTDAVVEMYGTATATSRRLIRP